MDLRKIIVEQNSKVMALQAENKNMKSNVTELNGHMETKGQMHTQKAFIDKMIKKQRADRERLYSKLGGSELGGQAYGEEERFVNYNRCCY